MPITEKLAYEIFIINSFHIVAILLLVGFTYFLYLKAEKNSLLYKYLLVIAMVLIWMLSKILKTVSPNEAIRWFFISSQYFGVQFIGFFLIHFSYHYVYERPLKKRWSLLILLPPFVCFLIVITNPLHMKFYSYYDFYKDHFGVLFIPTQAIEYLYLLTGVGILIYGYIKKKLHKKKNLLSLIFSLIVVFSLFFNLYYLLFKFDILPWFFPFPVFDITPICISISLLLFSIPAFRYRFLDVTSLSYNFLFNHLTQGIVILSRSNRVLAFNTTFLNSFSLSKKVVGKEITSLFPDLTISDGDLSYVFYEYKKQIFLVKKYLFKESNYVLSFTDMKKIHTLRQELLEQNQSLEAIHRKLTSYYEDVKHQSITNAKKAIAQNLHDILGHSLTIAIRTSDLLPLTHSSTERKSYLNQIRDSLELDIIQIQDTLLGKYPLLEQNTLFQSIESLKNNHIYLDFSFNGVPCALSTIENEAIFFLCQESITNSIKHGNASTLHFMLIYNSNQIQIYSIDDGNGCSLINKNYGLSGITERFTNLGGTVSFGSDGEKGFHIHASLPIARP